MAAAFGAGTVNPADGLDYDDAAETGHVLRLDQSSTDITLTAFQAAWGDGNMDCQVDSTDLLAILAAGKCNAGPSAATWCEDDFDDDSEVDAEDASFS